MALPLGSPYLGRFCVGCQYRVPSILCADFFEVVKVCRYMLHIYFVFDQCPIGVHGLLARSVTGLSTV